MTKLHTYAYIYSMLCIVSVQHWYTLTSKVIPNKVNSIEYRHKNNPYIAAIDPLPFSPSIVVALLYREDKL